MCTVTFIAAKNGYRLGMNRDEKLARVRGLPPQLRHVRGREVIAPSEPSGGTWISVNNGGVCFALINWYSVSMRVTENAASRGSVVSAISANLSQTEVECVFATLPLERINPFRLIAVFPNQKRIMEWHWNLQHLTNKTHPWHAQQWISSGFDEPEAQRVRSRTFMEARRQKSFGSIDWLRRLHRSHAPKCGPFSTCMHRPDAGTVSYTEVSSTNRSITMRYTSGPLCGLRCAAAKTTALY